MEFHRTFLTNVDSNLSPLYDAFQPIILLLNMTGVNIDNIWFQKRNNKPRYDCKRIFMKIYQTTLLLFSMLSAAANIYVLAKVVSSLIQSKAAAIGSLTWIDSLVTCIILVNHLIHGSKLAPYMMQLNRMLVSLGGDSHNNNNNNNPSFTHIAKWAKILAIYNIIAFILRAICFGHEFWSWDDQRTFTKDYGNYFFGFPNLGPTISKVIAAILSLALMILGGCSRLYSSFIILLSYSLYRGVKQLNAQFKSKVHLNCQDVQRFQQIHQHLANLVTTFNSLCSPLILILVSSNTFQTITGYDEMKRLIFIHDEDDDDTFIIRALSLSIVYFTAIGFISCMTWTGGKLYFEVRATASFFRHVTH